MVALRGYRALLVPYGSLSGVRSGDRMMPWGQASFIAASNELLGRMIDPLGQPIDGLGPAPRGELRPIYADPLPQTERAPVNQRLGLGIRSLDAFTPVARGQRVHFVFISTNHSFPRKIPIHFLNFFCSIPPGQKIERHGRLLGIYCYGARTSGRSPWGDRKTPGEGYAAVNV